MVVYTLFFLEKAPTPTLSVLLSANLVLTKDPQPLYCKPPPCLFYHKIALRKAILGPSSGRNRSLVKWAVFLVKLKVWGWGPFPSSNSGFAEVPYQVPPWSLPDALRMPKNKSKEACLVPAPKARLYRKVLVAKCFPGCAEGPCLGQPHFHPKMQKKNRTWYQG